jgi:threonine/homoserine/homoserine lactone efflux protein
LIALLALLSPRLALFFIAIFSDMLSRAFDSWLLPLIGFFLLPWTTLAYAVMWDTGTRDVNGFEWFIVVLAFLADLASYAGGRSYRSARD